MSRRDESHYADAARAASPPKPKPPAPACPGDRVICPLCAGPGVEKKQKWFCARCGQLLQTCCD